MMSAVRLTPLVLGLALLVPHGALAQEEEEEEVPAVTAEPERGCPKRPEVVPFMSGALVGLSAGGWLAHQSVIPGSKDSYFTTGARDRAGLKPVRPKDARRLGAPDPRVPLWVFGKSDTAPCRGVPATWWAVRMGTDADRQTYLMAELKLECDLLPPGRLSGTPVALRQREEPTGCKLRRTSDNERSGPGGVLPDDLLEVVPVRTCEAPECLRMWEYFGAKWDGGGAVQDVTVTWMERGGQKEPCDWATEDFSALLLRTPGAPAPVTLKPGGTYFGTLYDATGPRTVLSRHLGVMHVYDVTRPKAAPKAVRFASPSEEDLAHARRTLSPCKR